MKRLLIALSLMLTLGASYASAAVAFDAAPTSSGFNFAGVTTRATGSFTVGSGANRACMVMLAMAANNATAITATCGGKTASLVTGTDSGTTTTLRTMIFCAIAPTSGAAQTASASWTTSMDADIGAFTVSGADQTTPCNHGTFVAATNAGANPETLSVTSTNGDLTAAIGYTLDNWTAETQTVTWGPDSSVCVGTRGPGTGTTVHSFTDSFSGQTVSVSGANFAAVAGAAACTDSHMLGVWRCDEEG